MISETLTGPRYEKEREKKNGLLEFFREREELAGAPSKRAKEKEEIMYDVCRRFCPLPEVEDVVDS